MSLLKEMVSYSEDIINKKILACKKHIWSCERFLNDLNKENFDFYFDEYQAQHFIDWFEQFKHRKGVLSGKRINCHPIQKLIFGNVYGWYHRETEIRRFNKAYWQVGRKNAKTQSLAGVGTYELAAFKEYSSEVYVAATKKDQAKILWSEAKYFLSKTKGFEGKFNFSYGIIRHEKSDSEMKALTQEDKKSGDGLNPQCGLIDEYHAHETDDYYEVIESGMMARKQPLMFIITTAGFELENPCFVVEYDYVSRILNPYEDVENDSYYVMINELDYDKNGELIDDIMDDTCYIKANPILASYPEGMRNLKEKAKTANDSPEKLRKFLTKNMNVWVRMAEGQYIDMLEWKKSLVENIEMFNKKVYIGVDLSNTLDITSVSIVHLKIDEDLEDEEKYKNFELEVYSKSFMPEEMLNKKIKMDRVPYDEWAKKGDIILCPGKEVDYIVVREWILNFCSERNLEVEKFCFDKWNASMLASSIRQKTSIDCFDVGQNIATLSEPTKKFRGLLYTGRVKIEENKVLNMAAANCIEKMDHSGNIMLDKSKAKKRIDPMAATINAVSELLKDLHSLLELDMMIIG